MTAALAWVAAFATFLGVHAWMRPEARAYRAYRRSIAAQRRAPIHMPRQRTNRES